MLFVLLAVLFASFASLLSWEMVLASVRFAARTPDTQLLGRACTSVMHFLLDFPVA